MSKMFHCGLCTYSAATKAHIAVHVYFGHDSKPVSWYEGNSDAEAALPPDVFKDLVKKKRYFCALTTTCQFSCLTDEVFRNHLETHEGCGSYRCHLCFGLAETCRRLLYHYQIDHGYFTVQCLYCDFGNDDDWIVMRHVMEQHSRRPFRMLLRSGDTPTMRRELQLLMREYLTSDPMKPAQPCAQLPPESLTQVNATLSDEEAMREVGQVALEHSSEVRPILDRSCKSKRTSSLDLQVEEKSVENHAAGSDASVTLHCSGRVPPLITEESLCPSSNECMQPEASESVHPSAYRAEQNLALEPKAQSLHEAETPSGLSNSWHLACNAENCSMEFRDIFDYLNHLTECHSSQKSFLCPKCDLTLSSADLSVHLVDKHSGFLFCPYQGCSFGSYDQCGLDDHIIQAHQVCQKSRNISVLGSEGGSCTTSTASAMNYTSAGSVDFTPMEICNEEGMVDKLHCDVNLEDSKNGLTMQPYFCAMCRVHYSTLTCYVSHMASEHSVPFFCGHCFKPYKRSRCLLVHAGCLHFGQPFSVFCFSDGKVTEIGPKVVRIWMKEAQQYLKAAHPRKMHSNGKTMLKNLKRALGSISSSCFEYVSSQEESMQSSDMPCTASRDLELAFGARRMSLHSVDNCSEDAVNSLLDSSQLWHGTAPPRPLCSGSSSATEKCLNQLGVVPDQFEDFGINLSTSPPQSQNASPSKSRLSFSRSVKLKILGSVYIDASSCKKVNGRIVVDRKVSRKLRMLSSQKLPTDSSLTEASGSLHTRASTGCHVCSQCLIAFTTFGELAMHIVNLHNEDFINGFDLASAVLSFGDNCDLLGSTFKHDKQPKSTAQLQFKQMQCKGSKRAADDCTLVCQHSSGVKVPYSDFSCARNLNPIVKLLRLPMVKKEPKD